MYKLGSKEEKEPSPKYKSTLFNFHLGVRPYPNKLNQSNVPPSPILNIRSTNRFLIKLNNIEGNDPESFSSRGPKGETKINQSHIDSKVLHLFSKILAFLSFHTIQIGIRQVICHKILSLIELPRPLKEIEIISLVLLRGTYSSLTDINSLCQSPKIIGPCKKDDQSILHYPCTWCNNQG